MIDPMTYLILLVLGCWLLREICGLVHRAQRKARGDRR